MPLSTLVFTLIIVGIALWAINRYIPMAPPVKQILNILVIVVVCYWLLQTLGVIDGPAIRLK
jgi:hypothetical protein